MLRCALIAACRHRPCMHACRRHGQHRQPHGVQQQGRSGALQQLLCVRAAAAVPGRRARAARRHRRQGQGVSPQPTRGSLHWAMLSRTPSVGGQGLIYSETWQALRDASQPWRRRWQLRLMCHAARYGDLGAEDMWLACACIALLDGACACSLSTTYCGLAERRLLLLQADGDVLGQRACLTTHGSAPDNMQMPQPMPCNANAATYCAQR